MFYLLRLGSDPQGRLLVRAQRGDENAFGALYDQLYPRVWRFVWRRTHHRQDAEDVVSRTFHRVLEMLQEIDPRRGSAVGFVLAIARNILIDDARARRPTVPLEELKDVLIGEASPHADFEREEDRRAVRAELARLDPQGRDLLLLRFADGLRHSEIAAMLGISEAAARQRCSRALNTVARALQERSAPSTKMVTR